MSYGQLENPFKPRSLVEMGESHLNEETKRSRQKECEMSFGTINVDRSSNLEEIKVEKKT